MSTLASTLCFSWFATGIYNLDSQRFLKASLDNRVEGWTETWGNRGENKVLDEGAETNSDADATEAISEIGREIDNQSVSILLSTSHPQLPIVLTQHRPAWFEQMVLRIAGIPHIVVNSKHITNEACGQLPYLSDCLPSKPPILVGRYHPSNLETNTTINSNTILTYLQDYRDVDLDGQAPLTTEHQKGLSRCFQYMIDSELSKILLLLRFENLDFSWEQIYRKQYIEASSIVPNKERRQSYTYESNWLMQLRGRFQASMERAVERKRLLGFGVEKNSLKKLLQRADEAYTAIDHQLQQNESNKNNKNNYLLGTNLPALVDVTLWAHLAESLCDVHLVVLLASYPRLVKYFQDMYRTYFSTCDGTGTVCDWKYWNEQQNLSNAFQKVPTLGKSKLSESSAFKDVIDLMQKLSLQNHDMIKVLGAVKAKRNDEPVPKAGELTSSVLYRWSMGSETLKEKRSPTENEQNPIRQKLMRDQIRNDQMWISGIVGVSAVAILLIQNGNSVTN